MIWHIARADLVRGHRAQRGACGEHKGSRAPAEGEASRGRVDGEGGGQGRVYVGP